MSATNTTTPAHGPFKIRAGSSFCRQQQMNLYELQKSSSLTDFTIRVGDHSMACHKVVLAATCPYFHALLRAGMKEAHKEEVELDCLEWGVIKEIVRYCYTCNINVEYELLKALVVACDFFITAAVC